MSSAGGRKEDLDLDILPAASGEDSYGLGLFSRDGFGGFLPQPPYFSGGPRRGFTFGLPAHRSFGHKNIEQLARKRKRGLISFISSAQKPRLYGHMVTKREKRCPLVAIRSCTREQLLLSQKWYACTMVGFLRRSRSEEHTSELQSRLHLVCRLLLEKKKNKYTNIRHMYNFIH